MLNFSDRARWIAWLLKDQPSLGKFFHLTPRIWLGRRLFFIAAICPSVVIAQVLEPLIWSALASHPAAQVQAALLESARTGVDTARWQYFPTPSVGIETASASRSDIAYQGDRTVFSLRLQQPLWTGGRLSAGMDKAEAGIIASQASLEEVRQQLAQRVVLAYGDWLSAYLKRQSYNKSRLIHARLSAQVKRRFDLGLSAQSDLTLALTRSQSLEAEIRAAEAQQAISVTRLQQLLGQAIDEEKLSAQFATPHQLGDSTQMMLGQALDGSPGIEKAKALAAVQAAVINERRADLSPEIYLKAEQQYGNHAYRDTPSESRLFIVLSSRLGAGLSSLSGIETAKSQHAAAMAEIETQRRTVTEQVVSDFALASAAKMRLALLTDSLRAVEEVSDSYGRQYLAGKKTWLDVMNAAREQSQLEIQVADTASSLVAVTWRLAIQTKGLAHLLGEQK